MTIWAEPAPLSITMDTTPPDPLSFSGDGSKDLRANVVKLEPREIGLEPRPKERRRTDEDSFPAHLLLSAEMPELPLSKLDELKRREFQDSPSPPVAYEKPTRQRVALARTPSPNVKQIAMPQNAGIDDESPADFSNNPPPKYPAQAVAARLEGTVLLQLEVSEQGTVKKVRVLKSSGHLILDQAASSAILLWNGKPATRFGRNVARTEVIPIRFRL
ncbi:MAG: TonB family protein [Planctomycetota bacterium]